MCQKLNIWGKPQTYYIQAIRDLYGPGSKALHQADKRHFPVFSKKIGFYFKTSLFITKKHFRGENRSAPDLNHQPSFSRKYRHTTAPPDH